MSEAEGERVRRGPAAPQPDSEPAGRGESGGVVTLIAKRPAAAQAAVVRARETPPVPETEPVETPFPALPTRGGMPVINLPPLPMARRRSPLAGLISFLLCVVLPTAIIGTYYAQFAAPQYVSEFRFAVTESNPIMSTTGQGSGSASQSLGNLATMISGYTVSNAGMQNYVVIDYLTSRQAVEQLEQRIKVRELYSGPEVESDAWSRFDRTQPIEKFVEYWKKMITTNYDPATGLAVAQVRAFKAADAQLIASTLVTLSEDLVNTIARRAQIDAVRFAEENVQRAQDRMKEVRVALSLFRSQEGVIDPGSSVIATNIELVKGLRASLIQLETDQVAQANQNLAPNAPAAQLLRSRIAATRDQLAKLEREVGANRQGARALADVVARFELLELDRQYAQQMLISSMQSFDQARANASAQHLYLTPYVKPSLPQSAILPKRFQSTLLAGLGFFALWITGAMLFRTVREHV